ncbi:murein DD-endopeptidase MepM/ murein hydrolase activator NlpD [Porphyrobacter sp. MBR-155]|jgi:murein DD-endopeptidase MepM/ murein hydrolase activator NlpD
MRCVAVAVGAIALALSVSCSGGDRAGAQSLAAADTPTAIPKPALPNAPAAAPTPQTDIVPARFTFAGELTQGGWIRGRIPAGAVSARLGDQPLTFDTEGHFFAAFDRDAGPEAELAATLQNGRVVTTALTIAPRAWQIERVNVARRSGGSSEAFMKRRRPELARIIAARAIDTGAQGWRQQFIWPVRGRISGRFGSQRIYRGEPGSYHSGIDIAGGDNATFVAPADGVVVLATDRPFSLEGYLLIIDHGNGLNSAFLHNSAILVREGDAVRQGQPVGRIGASGRATGPHLHWGIKWRDARLDPLLFTGPMN